jgi:5'-3' exonuclease
MNLCLIDSKNLACRAHYVHRFLSSRGRCTSTLFGALKMIAATASRMPDTAFVFVWDGKGKTWRHELSKGEYKGNRQGVNEEMAPMFPQIPILRKALDAAGFRQFDFDNLECDDLIGILTAAVVYKGLFKHVIIYSTDKDFYQLVTDHVGVMRGYDKERIERVYYAKDIAEEEGLAPEDWVKVRALTGDATDNIPKIATGLGPKTAIKMIQAGLDPSLPEFKKHKWVQQQQFQTLAPQWEKVRRNYKLSRILCAAGDEQLPESVREKVVRLVQGLTQESFLRDPKKLDDESFSRFTEFLLDYEMQELWQQRFVLWKLP